MLGDSIGDDFAVFCHGIHLHLLGVEHELRDDHGVFLADRSSQFEETLQFVLVGADIHRRAGEHIRGADEDGEAHFLNEAVDIVHRGEGAPLGLVHADTVEHGRELIAVFGIVNRLRGGAKDRHVLCVEFEREVVRNLPACGDNHTVGVLQLEDIHHALEGQLVEIKAVAHVVVGGDGLGVVVYHHGAVSVLANGLERLHAAPVELHGGADTVSTGAEHDDGALVVEVLHIVGYARVGQVEVVGLCGELTGEGVYLLHHRQNAFALAVVARHEDGLVHIHLLAEAQGFGNLEIRETAHLRLTQQVGVECFQREKGLQTGVYLADMLQFLKEPAVNLRQFVQTVDGVAAAERLREEEDTLVGRCGESMVKVIHLQGFVLGEAVHALSYHTEAFLDGVFEGAPYRHHLSDGFHG